MKHVKRITTFSLVAALAGISFLTACSNKTTDNGSEPTANKEQTVKRGEITSTIYDRGNVPAGQGTIENNRWTKWINEKGPADVKFTAVPRGESQQKLNVLFASGSAPDVIFEYSPAIKNSLYDQKQLMPVDDMIEKYSTQYKKMLKEYPLLKKASTKSDGKMYEFGKLNEVFPLYTLFVREDWLKKLSLEVPKTTEELIKIAEAFATKDPDGNGKKDTYGLALSGDSDVVFRYMFNAYSLITLKNNEITVAWDNWKAFAEFRRTVYEKELVDKDFLADKNGAKAKQEILNGKVGLFGILTGDYTSFTTKDLDTFLKNTPDAKLLPIALPKTSVGQFLPSLNNPIQVTTVVNARAKDPEAVMKFIDFMSTPSTGNTIRYGLEGEHYKKGANGCPEILDQDKYKNELSWTGDFTLLYSRVLQGKCGMNEAFFNPEIPVQKEGLRLFKLTNETYMKPELQVAAGITHPEHMPQLPKELQAKMNSLSASGGIDDFFIKASIGKDNYTVEQAMKDAQAAWEKGSGNEVTEFYKKWWSTDRDKSIQWKDVFEIAKQQQLIK